MKRILIFNCSVLLMFFTTECRKSSPVHNNGTGIVLTPINNSARTYLALGDSYTIGQSVAENERFPAQTTRLLRTEGIPVKDPEYIATTGWTTDNLTSAIASRQPVAPYSVVSLLIGVNDQYQRHDTTGYRMRFRSLLQKSIELAGNEKRRVFVLSIPDYSVTPYAMNADTAFIRMQVDQFNQINLQETTAAQCNYLDITPSTREARFDLSLLAADGLHPSGKEYGKWATRLAPKMATVLR